jgi:uncharacterized membrane protein YeaQ/YmgE (transglycosylase-associated protein family)
MYQHLGVLGTPHIGFFGLIIIGGLAGWIAGRLIGERNGLFTNILVGICGSFVGSKAAELADVMVVGRLGQFVAALIGSVAVLWIWRLVQQSRPPQAP